MSDRGLSIFDDEPDDVPDEAPATEQPADAEPTQVMPVVPPAPAPTAPATAEPTQRRPVLPPDLPRPAPAGTVAEAAQVYSRQATQSPATQAAAASTGPASGPGLPTVRRGGYDK